MTKLQNCLPCINMSDSNFTFTSNSYCYNIFSGFTIENVYMFGSELMCNMCMCSDFMRMYMCNQMMSPI